MYTVSAAWVSHISTLCCTDGWSHLFLLVGRLSLHHRQATHNMHTHRVREGHAGLGEGGGRTGGEGGQGEREDKERESTDLLD